VDTETDSLDPMAARIVGISFAVEPGRAAYVPTGHVRPRCADQLPLDAVLAALKPWLEDAGRPKVGQNLKYDLHVLANHGITVRGYPTTRCCESYVLEAHKGTGLEKLAERHLGRKGLSYEDLCGKGATRSRSPRSTSRRPPTYSGEDSEMALQVHQTLWPQLQAEGGCATVYADIEMPVDADPAAHRAPRRAGRRRGAGRAEPASWPSAWWRWSSRPIDRRPALQPGQPEADRRDPVRQARPAGEEEDRQRRAEHRRRSAAGAGRRLPAAGAHPRVPQPGQAQGHLHRQAAADGEPGHRPRAHQLRAGGGGDGAAGEQRPEPAEHPHPHARGPARARGLRRAAGHRILSADYSQIELRIMAHISEDPGLLRAFAEGIDVHRATASEVFNVPLDEVSASSAATPR
jgi:DNA polymerase-1